LFYSSDKEKTLTRIVQEYTKDIVYEILSLLLHSCLKVLVHNQPIWD